MLIVDGQVHIWAADTPARPWPVKHPPHLPHHGWPAFSKDELLRAMDTEGVQRAVIIPPSWEGEHNDVALEAARLHPDRFAVMGRLNLNAPGARGRIANWRQQPGMLGLRFTTKDAFHDWLWTEAESAGVVIMMGSTELASQAAQRHPGLKLVIDHLAIQLDTKDDEAFANLDDLLALARYPNVAVKATSLPKYSSEGYPYRRFHPYIRRAFDAFGPRRMFWGSDFTGQPCTYRETITLFTEELPWLTADDKEWIMGRGLCEWLGWPLPQATASRS